MNFRFVSILTMITIITSLFLFHFSYTKLISIIQEEEFKNLINNKKPLILKFSADYCPPCRITKEPFKEVANEPEFSEIAFAEIDIGSSEGNVIAQQSNILGVPTFVYIRDGNEVDRVVGLENVQTFKEDLKIKLKENFGETIALAQIKEKLPKDKEIRPEDMHIEIEEELTLPLPEVEIPQPQEARGIMAQLWGFIVSFFSFFIEKMKELWTYVVDLIKKLFGG